MSKTAESGDIRARATRGDHQRNHELLLNAAQEIFDEQGIYAPLHEIATRALLSVPTLYRHFPTRTDILKELYARGARAFVEATRLDAEVPEGGAAEAIEAFIQGGLTALADRPSLLAIAHKVKDSQPDFRPGRRMLAPLQALVDQAKREGALADDVTAADLPIAVMTIAAVSAYGGLTSPDTWNRHLGFLMRGMSPAGAHGSPLPGPGDAAHLGMPEHRVA